MSKRKMNNKGMTLVEIVIVLLIASIAMTITGGILINSLGYFQDTTELSTDKTAGDGILDFIKSEIQYSTYVCVDKDHPTDMTGDWHNLYVDGDQLYKDDSPVWGDTDKKGDYYNNRNLNIKAKGFNNGYRLDMVISLNTGSGTQVDTKYKVSHTFEFLNLKRQKAANASFENPLANIVNKNEELSPNKKLWYIKDTDAITPDTDDGGNSGKDDDIPDTGTVADQIKCLNNYNNRGSFSTTQKRYFLYDFVYSDGFWWQLVNGKENFANGDTNPLLTTRKWKKIDKYYDYRSAYEEGDVIYYKKTKQYYRCRQNIINNGVSEKDDWVAPDNKDHGTTYWTPLGNTISSTDDQHKYSRCDQDLSTQRLKTVLNKMDSLTSEQINNISEYRGTTIYNIGSWVYREVDGIKQYYLKVADGEGTPGTSATTGWQIVSRDWDVNSAYVKGDKVYYTNGGNENAVEYTNTVNFELNLKTGNYKEWVYGNNGSKWQLTFDYWNTQGDKYYKQISAY